MLWKRSIPPAGAIRTSRIREGKETREAREEREGGREGNMEK